MREALERNMASTSLHIALVLVSPSTWKRRPSVGLPFTAKIMSPTAMAPCSSAGCPGKSLLILTRSLLRWLQLSLYMCTKLNPKPLVFFFSLTSNLGPVLWDIDKNEPFSKIQLTSLRMQIDTEINYFCLA
jgi:hypothetical protein